VRGPPPCWGCCSQEEFAEFPIDIDDIKYSLLVVFNTVNFGHDPHGTERSRKEIASSSEAPTSYPAERSDGRHEVSVIAGGARTVPFSHSASWFRKILALPARASVAVGLHDPGIGLRTSRRLEVWIHAAERHRMSSLMAMFLQALSAKLGIATGATWRRLPRSLFSANVHGAVGVVAKSPSPRAILPRFWVRRWR